MPRLDGIELVTLIKRDARTADIPVMIVSYKDREEDRQRGLDAGADYYLAKGSFHDDALLRAVVDLIGESGA
jgi:two-component system sensor histidine kinase and response regulator WspE